MFALPPDRVDEHVRYVRLADWIEINLLLGEESVISIANLQAELTADPPDSADDSEKREQFWDAAESLADDAFAELVQRAQWFTSSYPIVVEGEAATLRTLTSHLELWRFVALLRARHLYPNALDDDGSESGQLFEELVCFALGAYTGSRSDHSVRFGPAGGDRGDSFPRLLPDAIRELCARMGEQVGTLPKASGGDYGADVFVWLPFGDRHPGQLVLIGQATISEGKWTSKQPARRWTDSKTGPERLIDFVARPVTAVAFVETLSSTSDDILRGLPQTFSSIPFDRLRLLSTLRSAEVPAAFLKRVTQWVERISRNVPQ